MEIKWIKVQTNTFDGLSFKKIKQAKTSDNLPMRDTLTAVWFELLALAGKSNNDGGFSNEDTTIRTINDIAVLLDREEKEIELCLNWYMKNGMIENKKSTFKIMNWSKYQDNFRDKYLEQNRNRQQKFKEKKQASNGQNEEEKRYDNVSETLLLSLDKKENRIEVEEELKNKKNSIEKKENDTAPEIGAINVEKTAIDVRVRFDNKIFETFWNNYPRKIGKQKCQNWFKAHKVKQELLEKMIASVNEQKKSEQWQKDNGAFIPHPYTWLNQGRWDDESEVDLDIVLTDKEKTQLAEQEKRKLETIEQKQKLMQLNLIDNRLKDTTPDSLLHYSLTLDKMVLLGKITREEADDKLSEREKNGNVIVGKTSISGIFKKI